jgi:tetratricopeptide (TPR) repeat protein
MDQGSAAQRAELESALLGAFEESLQAIYGLGAPEPSPSAGRPYEPGQRSGRALPHWMRVLRTQAELSALRGEHERAIELAGELLRAAERAQDSLDVAAAHAILAHCRAQQGGLAQASMPASQAIVLGPDPSHTPAAENMPARQPYAGLLAALALLCRGYADQAREQIERIAAAQAGGAREVTAHVQNVAAMFYAALHDDRLARRWAEEVLRTIEGQEMPEARAWCERTLGWVEARSRPEDWQGSLRANASPQGRGIARLRAAMNIQPMGAIRHYRFAQAALLAEAYLAAGQREPALQTVEEALARIDTTVVHVYEAELWRLRGEAVGGMGRRGDTETRRLEEGEAEACFRPEDFSRPAEDLSRPAEEYFRRAIEIARRQGVRLFDLRATLSLARLWRQEARSREAQEALAAVYATFSEGFDTPDLVEARALLDDLGVETGRPATG